MFTRSNNPPTIAKGYIQVSGRTLFHRDARATLTKGLEEVVFEEIALRVRRVDGPEIVCDDVEYAKNENQEGCRPLGLEADGNHDAGYESDDGYEDASNGPLALDDESEEEEDEKYTACKEEALL